MNKSMLLSFVCFLFLFSSVEAQERMGRERPTAESMAKEQTADYKRDLGLNKEQTDQIYKVFLKNNEAQMSMRGSSPSAEDKAKQKKEAKASSKEIMEMLDSKQKRKYKTLRETESLQKDLELSDLQRRALFNAMIASQEGRNGSKGEQAKMSAEDRQKMKKDKQAYSESLKDILNKSQFKEYMVLEETKKLKKKLDLSKDQTKKVTSILEANSNSKVNFRGDKTSRDREAMKAAKKEMEDQKNAKIMALLNAEQKKKFEEMLVKGNRERK